MKKFQVIRAHLEAEMEHQNISEKEAFDSIKTNTVKMLFVDSIENYWRVKKEEYKITIPFYIRMLVLRSK